MKQFNYRLAIFAIAFIFGIAFSLPTLMQSSWGKKITLGLDLQGGLHMVLGVKTDVAIESRSKSIATSLKFLMDENDIIYDNLAIQSNVIKFELLDNDDVAKLKGLVTKEIQGVALKENKLNFSIALTPEEIAKTKQNAISQAVETIRNRLDMYGLAEPTVAKQGEDKVLVEIAGVKTGADEQRIRDLIAKSAHLQMMAVDEERAARVTTMTEAEAATFGDVILKDVSTNAPYLLKDVPILDGSMLTDASVGYNQSNQPVINFELNSQGAKIFGDFSGKSIGKRMAIVLDDKVYSAPVINERIGGGKGQISGSFSQQEAHDVAIALRSGALLAPVVIEEKRSIGPSLGADSINASLMALVFGFLAVVVFMAIYYGIAGVIADIAVIVNIFLIVAIMSLFGATLTLPGMAGIVLTIGIAVDSNIIINERVREALRQGMSLKKALNDGYSNGMRAILDSNITQVLACTILYAYGTGAIKGFALTLSIGILASMLTAILGTHGVYDILLSKIEKTRSYNFWFGLGGK
ncbi:MAG: protein translocase subunit SecD [Sulfurovaceae bacterium]|nr:protein translocase subunit SecD [Sulfurovaceae bacterium]MDD5548941.1 protein translocase subunit SecD [Sulfurovaceae bacterium]